MSMDILVYPLDISQRLNKEMLKKSHADTAYIFYHPDIFYPDYILVIVNQALRVINNLVSNVTCYKSYLSVLQECVTRRAVMTSGMGDIETSSRFVTRPCN